VGVLSNIKEDAFVTVDISWLTVPSLQSRIHLTCLLYTLTLCVCVGGVITP
jgi:hypothetical protein